MRRQIAEEHGDAGDRGRGRGGGGSYLEQRRSDGHYQDRRCVHLLHGQVHNETARQP